VREDGKGIRPECPAGVPLEGMQAPNPPKGRRRRWRWRKPLGCLYREDVSRGGTERNSWLRREGRWSTFGEKRDHVEDAERERIGEGEGGTVGIIPIPQP
jgi:hypothetical protein